MPGRLLAGGLRRVLQATPVRAPRTVAARMSAASMPRAGGGCASAAEVAQLVDSVKTFVFDLDGVVWRGADIVPNAPETLRALRKRGKRLVFCTNNSSKSREQYVGKFGALGIEAAAQEIVGSAYAAAAYLESLGFASSGKRVLLLGPEGVELELQQAGIPYVTPTQLALPPLDSLEAMQQLRLDPGIGAVLVGWDLRFEYTGLVYASACLRELPGCLFVATNTDNADRIGGAACGDRMMPGTGCLVAALEAAAGRPAFNVGKGGPWLFPFLCDSLGLDPAACCVVGDRLDTDIALGKQGGMRTVLPLTGVTTLEDVAAAGPGDAPDLVVPSMAALGGW